MFSLKLEEEIDEAILENSLNKIMRHYDAQVNRINLLRRHGGSR